LTQLTKASGGRPTRRSRTSGRGTRLALRLIWLALLSHVLRSRRFYERMAVGAIVLAALRGINQESRASTLERLATWNKKQTQNIERRAERTAHRIERRAERTAQHIERRAERTGKRLTRKAKGQRALNQ
jgi:hypothetical protein